MQFNGIPGFDDIKAHLKSTVTNNKVAHAQLFAGQEGAPVLAFAVAYANYLLCENKREEGACGTCNACSKSMKYIHPDVQFIFPTVGTAQIPRKDALSYRFLKEWRSFLANNPYSTVEEWTASLGEEDKVAIIPIDESREIIKNITLKPFEAEIKIVIIWLPEEMAAPAATALLKVLEEPTGKCIFILATHEPDNLLTTIQSRTQRLVIRKFSDQEIVDFLISQYQIDEIKAKRLSHLSDGSIHMAKKLLQDVDHNTHDWFRDWMRACFTFAATTQVDMADEFGKMNKTMRKSVLDYGLSMMRETAISQTNPDLGRAEGEDLKFANNFGKVMDIAKIEEVMNLMNDSIYHLERNANAKIEFLNLSLEITKTFKK